MLALDSHPPIAKKDEPSTHQSFWWMLVLYEWRSMNKTQYMNDVQHINGQEMHREVRAVNVYAIIIVLCI
jgi:hypothetical protein